MSAAKSTSPIIQTRHTTVKKDREIFDQQRHTHELKLINSRSVVKQEPKHELIDEDDEDDAEYDDDEYSYSASGHTTPMPVSPEPALTSTSIKNPSILLDQQQLLSVRSTSQKADQVSTTHK